METVHLKRTPGPEISFEGELVVRAEGDREDALTLGRCHDISIYRKSLSDQWVVCVEYNTTATSETPVTDVEVVDTVKDIELVLQMYEPNAYVNRDSLRTLYEEARKRMNNQLFSNYDRQVHDVLQRLASLGVMPQEASSTTEVAEEG